MVNWMGDVEQEKREWNGDGGVKEKYDLTNGKYSHQIIIIDSLTSFRRNSSRTMPYKSKGYIKQCGHRPRIVGRGTKKEPKRWC